ncbi:hypothetical protein LCGC14_1604460 [marine sediment metagenome]|uniref:Uncharacterized protein n=1 Tax=marine sediment metagenome TaxID=412755 RepID=A0A0F9LA91_9ZZZZ
MLAYGMMTTKSKFIDEKLSNMVSETAYAIANIKILKSHVAAINRSNGDFSDEDYMEDVNIRQLLDDCFEEALIEIYEE